MWLYLSSPFRAHGYAAQVLRLQLATYVTITQPRCCGYNWRHMLRSRSPSAAATTDLFIDLAGRPSPACNCNDISSQPGDSSSAVITVAFHGEVLEADCLLFTVHCSLFTFLLPSSFQLRTSSFFHRLLFTVYCSLFTVYFFLPASSFELPASFLLPSSFQLRTSSYFLLPSSFQLRASSFFYRSPFTVYCLLFTVHCSLFTVYCLLFTVHCSPLTYVLLFFRV